MLNNPSESVTFSKFSQKPNAFAAISLTLPGITTLTRFLHHSNASSSIISTPSGIVIFASSFPLYFCSFPSTITNFFNSSIFTLLNKDELISLVPTNIIRKYSSIHQSPIKHYNWSFCMLTSHNRVIYLACLLLQPYSHQYNTLIFPLVY